MGRSLVTPALPCLAGAGSARRLNDLKGSNTKERPKVNPELTLATTKCGQINPDYVSFARDLVTIVLCDLLPAFAVTLCEGALLAPFRISKTFLSSSFFYTLKIELL